MKTVRLFWLIGALAMTLGTTAQEIPVLTPSETGNVPVPERAIILTGGQNGLNKEVMAVLYDTKELDFQDPNAPRFLLIDRKGTTVFGIGGYTEGIVQYDFNGAIDNASFITHDINVPLDPSERNRFGADASRTNIFMQMVTRTKWGILTAYAQGNFSNSHYGFKLKQAYIKLNNVTAGLARTTFSDAMAGVPTIDYQGPSGAVTGKNLLVQYKKDFAHGFAAAISAELPSTSYTTHSGLNKSISQRVPDIPVYVQYSWDEAKSHVRLSGMLRELSYRNLTEQRNHFVTGWGVQLSGAVRCTKLATIMYQANYGKGIGRYINDLSGFGYDLISDTDGSGMHAPGSLGLTCGVRFNLTRKLFVSGTYSMCRLYDQESLGEDGYRRASYAVANAFWTPIPDLQLGIEYLHGTRVNMDGDQGSANRVQAMIKYSF